MGDKVPGVGRIATGVILGWTAPPAHFEAAPAREPSRGTPLGPLTSSGIREEVSVTDRVRYHRASALRMARVALAGAALSLPLPGSAQTLRGRVVEAVTENGIPGATVTLVDSNGASIASAIAGTAGTFVLRAPGAADYTLSVEHIGYARGSHGPIQLASDQVHEMVLRMTIQVIALNPLTVEVDAGVQKLQRVGFYDRKRLGQGSFIDRDQISPYARSATDILRSVSGLRLIVQGYFTDVQARGVSNCRPAIYLDGALASGPRRSVTSFNLEDLPAPDIEAVEIYPGAASVPPQYTGGNSACGIILFWTTKPGR
jgi:hypothetical protein